MYVRLIANKFCKFRTFLGFFKPNKPTTDETWEDLSPEEQQLLIKRYQTLKEIPTNQSTQLQQRMEWFTQLPEEEKQKCVMYGKNEYSRTQYSA